MRLISINIGVKKQRVINLLFEGFDFCDEMRCDRHSRFSFDGKKVFFDSVHENKRHLYMLDLENKNG